MVKKIKPGELRGPATCLCGEKRFDLDDLAKSSPEQRGYFEKIKPCSKCDSGPMFRVVDVTSEGLYGPPQEAIEQLSFEDVKEKVMGKLNKRRAELKKRPPFLKATTTLEDERLQDVLGPARDLASAMLLGLADRETDKRLRAGERRQAWLGTLEMIGEIRARAEVEILNLPDVLLDVEEYLTRQIRIAEFNERGERGERGKIITAPLEKTEEIAPGVYRSTLIYLTCPGCKTTFSVEPGKTYTVGWTMCARCRGTGVTLPVEPEAPGEATDPIQKAPKTKSASARTQEAQTTGAQIVSGGVTHIWKSLGDPAKQSFSSLGVCSCGYRTEKAPPISFKEWATHAMTYKAPEVTLTIQPELPKIEGHRWRPTYPNKPGSVGFCQCGFPKARSKPVTERQHLRHLQRVISGMKKKVEIMLGDIDNE